MLRSTTVIPSLQIFNFQSTLILIVANCRFNCRQTNTSVFRPFVFFAFKVTVGHVVEHQSPLLEMSFRQAAFNLRLAFHEIIHRVIEIVLIRAKQRATVPLAHQHRRNILPIIGIKLDVSNRNLAEYELQIVSLTQNRRRVNPRISQSICLDSNCRMLSHSSHTHKYKTAGGRSITSHKNRYSHWAISAGNYTTWPISPLQQRDSQRPDPNRPHAKTRQHSRGGDSGN